MKTKRPGGSAWRSARLQHEVALLDASTELFRMLHPQAAQAVALLERCVVRVFTADMGEPLRRDCDRERRLAA